jgi:sec-independent protein translocase protein TatC
VANYFIEIRNRLILVFFAIIGVLFISYFYKETLLFLLLKPSLTNNLNFKLFYFIFTDVTEIFSVYLKIISFIIAQVFLIVSIFQIFSFLCLALFTKEYLFLAKLLKMCFAVWCFSFLLSSFFLIPLSWEFFFYFQSILSSKFIPIHFEPKISEYITFCILLYSMTMFYFQVLFILVFVISYFNSNIKIIKKYKKLYYYNFIVFSTLITPPDVFSQIFIGLFLVICYELFTIIFILKTFLARKVIKTN